MLSRCFREEDCIARLRAGPGGQHLDGFAAYLYRRGYARSVVQSYVQKVVHLMRVVALDGVTAETLTESHLRAFRDHVASCGCHDRPSPRARCLQGPRRFLEYLRREGVMPPRSLTVSPPQGLEKYFKDERCIARLRAEGAGRYFDGFADHIGGLGFEADTIRGCVASVVHMMRVMARDSVGPEVLDDGHVSAFRTHLTRCRCRRRPRGDFRGARRFLEYLRSGGVAPPRRAPKESALVVRFCDWMRRHRGSSETTLEGYCRAIRRFLTRAGDDAANYDARILRSFVVHYGRGTGKHAAQAMRQFLRFVIAEGLCPVGLDNAIPTIAHWRLSSLPRYLPAKDVERIIGEAANSARDHAMLLLLARLGLRNGDLRALQIGDIDWQRGRLRLVGKSRREALLPLPQDVGDALLHYIETERPQGSSEHVFFTKTAPVRPLGRGTARGVVRSAICRAGIKDPPSHGCHLLRHSAATDMLRRGMTLDEIGVLLRHRFHETTEIYAKVDLNALREIAQPWPTEAA